MPGLGEELYFLNAFGMSLKSMNPLFRDVIWSWFSSLEVLWDFSKLDSFLPMKYRWCPEFLSFFFLLISLLWLSSLLSPHFLILFDSFLLFWGWFLHILLFEFFHPFIQSPWSFEILIFRLPLVLSFLLVFATYLFLGFFCLRFFKF